MSSGTLLSAGSTGPGELGAGLTMFADTNKWPEVVAHLKSKASTSSRAHDFVMNLSLQLTGPNLSAGRPMARARHARVSGPSTDPSDRMRQKETNLADWYQYNLVIVSLFGRTSCRAARRQETKGIGLAKCNWLPVGRLAFAGQSPNWRWHLSRASSARWRSLA